MSLRTCVKKLVCLPRSVMLIPLQLLKDLRKSKYDKLRLASLFTVGIFTVIVSLIRVFLIYAKTGSTTPSPAWLGLWAIIECMTGKAIGSPYSQIEDPSLIPRCSDHCWRYPIDFSDVPTRRHWLYRSLWQQRSTPERTGPRVKPKSLRGYQPENVDVE